MLLPVGTGRDAERAVAAAVSFAHLAGEESGELVLLHVEDGRPAPQLTPPSGFRITVEHAHGLVEDAVVAAAERTRIDLLVMLTAGHDGFGDVLLASHTERVLHRCGRPLLWVPLDG
jgi:nucleotide-binding universal stress UspA family protein